MITTSHWKPRLICRSPPRAIARRSTAQTFLQGGVKMEGATETVAPETSMAATHAKMKHSPCVELISSKSQNLGVCAGNKQFSKSVTEK